jgi:hypothetical protein
MSAPGAAGAEGGGDRSSAVSALRFAVVTFVAFRGGLLLLEYVGVRLFPPAGACRPQWQVFSADFDFWNGFFRWDGAWYRRISEGGYSYNQGRSSNVAFYPLFPYLARVTGVVLRNRYAAGLVDSHLATFGAIYFMRRLGERFFSRETTERAIVFLLVFPTSFFLSAFYTEALFLFLATATLYAFYEERYVLCGLAGFFAMLSRSSGMVLFAALFIDLAFRSMKRKLAFRWSMLALFLIPGGLLAFMVILDAQVGDPLAFSKVMVYWGRQTSLPWTPIIDALSKLTPGLPRGVAETQSVLDAFTALSFLGIAAGMVWFRFPVAFVAFVALGVLLPLTTYNLDSMGRYVLVLFPAFFFLSTIAGKKPLYERAWLLGSCFFLAVYALRFMRCGWAG